MQPAIESVPALLARAERAKRAKDWPAVAALGAHLPEPLDLEAAKLADEVAFALGQLRRHREAIALFARSFALEPTWRRASALAYQHYAAAIAGADPALDRERLREGLRAWIERALELRPDSVEDPSP